jgi:plasmid maintenance system antidote protein VapI
MDKVYRQISKKYRNQFDDIDIQDFVTLKEMGLSRSEIAKELGVPESEINKFINDINCNY